MPDPDYSLAAQIKPPQAPNPLETLIGLENFRRTRSQADTAGLEAQQKGIDVQKLANYGQSGNLQDFRGASPELGVQATEQAKQDYLLGAEHRARVAYGLLGEKDPKRKLEGFQTAGDDWVKRGWYDAKQWQAIRNNPSDLILNNIIRGSSDIQKHMQMTGQTTAADNAAAAPYQFHDIPAGTPAGYPAVMPGGPLGPGAASPVGTIQRPGAPAPSTPSAPVVPPGAPVAPPGSPAAISARAANPAPNVRPGATEADQFNANDKYYQEAPSRPIGAPMRTGPGVVNQGASPLAMEAAKDGLAQGIKLSDTAAAAARDQAELGSLRSELQSGRVKTGTFTELRMQVAGAIAGITNDTELARNLTGISQPWNEVFNKDATRRGLTYARQTEGAREAVQAISIALRAQPGLMNTPEGNLKVLDILEAGDKYDQEYSRGAQSYMLKQQDTTGTGHLQGFPDWFVKQHPPSQTVSKAVPYQLPPDPGRLQDGVTYEFKTKDGHQSGTYNAKTHHFDPVEQ